MFVALVAVFALFVTIWYLSLVQSRKGSLEPPGPVPLPLLGDLVTITKASVIPHEALGILAKKYGEIFKLQMGTLPTVVLASAEAVKTVFTKDEGCGRDCRGVFYDRSMQQNLGLGFSNGEVYNTTRMWAMKALRDCGFGRNNSMELIINEEARHFMEKADNIIKNTNGVFDADMQFSIHTLNVSWIMFTGSRTGDDDNKIQHLLKASDEFVRAGMFGMGAMVAYPFLRFVFPELTGYNIQMKCVSKIYALAKEVLDEHRLKGNYKYQPTNFIESYLQKMDEDESKPKAKKIFTEDHFKVMFADLFQGSFETTAGFLEAVLLHMAINQTVQEKIQQEIDEIIGDVTNIDMEHYKRMPYTQAAIMETHRHAKVLPQFIPHKALADFYYKNYLIKKDTIIIPATEAVNTDPAVFRNPDSFDVENFLTEDKQLRNLDKIFPFGIGGRRCPGQPVAEVIIFIFIVTLLRSYKVSTMPNEPTPITKLQLGFTSRPFPYKVMMTPRKQ